jgi:hypothetical protein
MSHTRVPENRRIQHIEMGASRYPGTGGGGGASPEGMSRKNQNLLFGCGAGGTHEKASFG